MRFMFSMCFVIFSDEHLQYIDITELKDCAGFVKSIDENDEIVICGDGTLNRFINTIYDLKITNNIYYYPTGSGNDFWRDLDMNDETKPVLINEYIENLPLVTVKGKCYRFINGVGFGIDGYCCEVGDEIRATGKKPNYTMIAIKGLLFGYKPTSAKVTVDGTVKNYKKIWIAPTMYGRYYGGGMMASPNQSRRDNENNVSFVAMHGAGKLRTLTVFPSIFSGTHIKHSKMVDEIKGKNVTVEFDRPVALQIDGETILNVKKYEVTAGDSVCAEHKMQKETSYAK